MSRIQTPEPKMQDRPFLYCYQLYFYFISKHSLSELPGSGKYGLVRERPNKRKHDRVRHRNNGFGCAGREVQKNPGGQYEKQQSCVYKHKNVHFIFLLYLYVRF